MTERTYNEDIAQALLQQQQCDEDGVMCIVSRQAADEGAGLIRRLTARVEELESDNARLRAALIPLVAVARDRCALDPAWRPSSHVSCLIRIDELRAAAMCLHEPCDDEL